jgi:hypothetical protein
MAARTTVERGAIIRADASQAGNGGEIIVNSTDRTEMRGTLSARGGAQGGNGGFIEVSGQGVFVLDGIIDLRAPAGAMGEFLLDPQNIIISDANNPTLPGSNTVEEVVTDLGITRIRLLTNHPRPRSGFIGYGLEIVENLRLGDVE